MDKMEDNSRLTTPPPVKKEMEGGVWGIIIIISAFMIQVLVFGATASIGVYNIELLEYFNNATVGVSLIAAINFGVFLGSGPIVSLMMTKFSYRKIALLGAVLVTLGLIGMPLFPYIPAMCFSFGILTGFGSCCLYIPSHVLSGLYYDKNRSLATGVATSGSGLGGAIMPVIVGTFIDIFSWKGSFIMLCGLCLHLFIFAALLRRPPSPTVEEEQIILPKKANGNEVKCFTSADAECSQSPLLDDSLKQDNDITDRSNGVKDLEKTQHFVDLNELEFIDAGFPSTENIYLSDEKTETKPDNQSCDEDNNGSVLENCQRENHVSVQDKMSSSASCDHQDFSRERQSPELSLQCEQSGHIDSSSPENDKTFTVKTSRHFYIFTSYGFNVYFVNNLLWNISISILQSFAPEFLTQRGLTPLTAAWVIGSFGLGCFIGGIVGGIGGNFKCMNRIAFFTIANFVQGVATILLPVFHDIALYIIVLAVAGISFGIILGLLIVVLTDLIGIDSLGNGLGYLMLANGIGTFLGPPIAGGIQSITGQFDESIYVSGALSILAGFVMLLLHFRGSRCSS